ncbi:hypothetical protein P175DRAFT_0554378 [Aspergillus ochraceoroseus IBT 24754]|uniref:Fucose-specific lectin n=1 Tax=Aspergillus ochraceoroseus IBT 24754 TaxID=1392256 RepID=A0A2T5M9C0_9EURO|nr:uncharacterized protein P175DRAFT_0554378 [Aspergillus ochraceoroseus IBT 24754]PTU25126.1 hypothetical protein P175DRAFT_0554378 [Aspergillus ochraceoroseus IBT 24754]
MSEMSNAITAIINPVIAGPKPVQEPTSFEANGSDKDSEENGDTRDTLLFELGEKNQLILSYIPLEENNKSVMYNDNGTIDGNATRPNALTSVYVKGIVNVFGLTEIPTPAPNGAARRRFNITRLSPIHNPVVAKNQLYTHYGALASASDGETVWLYYLQGETEGEAPTVMQAALKRGVAPTLNTLGIKVVSNSKLAALYDAETNTRSVIMQCENESEDLFIRVATIDANDKTSSVDISGTSNALKGTPLAATSIGYGPSRVNYLYLVDTTRHLHRSTQTGKGNWANPKLVEKTNEQKMMKDSQLAVVADETHNHVFYIEHQNPQNGYQNHRDDRK